MTPKEVKASIIQLQRIKAVPRLLDLNRVRRDPLLADDKLYRKSYNGYYRVRQRNPQFYNAMFSLLRRAASGELRPQLQVLMTEMFDATSERHLSFCSKILATVTDDGIVYDKNVASYFGVPKGQLPLNNWKTVALQRYEAIEHQIRALVTSSAWPPTRDLFDRAFESGGLLPDIRKAVLLIWAHVGLRFRNNNRQHNP